MASVRHRVGIRGSPGEIFGSLVEPSGLTGWWATSASGSSVAGSALELTFGELVTLSFEIRDLKADSQVRLACSSELFPWRGSRLEFFLEEAEDQVFVTLTHSNDDADDESFLYFNTKWPIYLLSLRDFIETGTGRPYPDDIKIHIGD